MGHAGIPSLSPPCLPSAQPEGIPAAGVWCVGVGPEPGHLQSGSRSHRSCPWLLVCLSLKGAASRPPEAPQLGGDLRTGLSSRNSLSALGRSGSCGGWAGQVPPEACRLPPAAPGAETQTVSALSQVSLCWPSCSVCRSRRGRRCLRTRWGLLASLPFSVVSPASPCCCVGKGSPRASWEEPTAIPGCGP